MKGRGAGEGATRFEEYLNLSKHPEVERSLISIIYGFRVNRMQQTGYPCYLSSASSVFLRAEIKHRSPAAIKQEHEDRYAFVRRLFLLIVVYRSSHSRTNKPGLL